MTTPYNQLRQLPAAECNCLPILQKYCRMPIETVYLHLPLCPMQIEQDFIEYMKLSWFERLFAENPRKRKYVA